MTKLSKKRKRSEIKEEENKPQEPTPLPSVRQSDEPISKKAKWINKQRVLVFASRGISHLHRHLMEDLKKLMPHHKPESKMERNKNLSVVNEMCEMKNCNKAVMFEGRKKMDLYMWLANVPNGPSAKFLVQNVYTMDELKMTGNCLRGSRPILSFDPTFNEKPQYTLLKEMFQQIFGVPKHHPKSQPFFDHVYTFTVLDNRIWFRNFQILSEDGALAEVGPRFVLNLIKIFSGSFGGVALWENPNYVSPSRYRQQLRLQAKNKYQNRLQQKVNQEINRPKNAYELTPFQDVFEGDPLEKAQEIAKTDEELPNKKDEKKKKTQENGIKKLPRPKGKISRKDIKVRVPKKKKVKAV